MISVFSLGRSLIKQLPKTGVRWSCCYGSKVMEADVSKTSQLDVLIAVDDNSLVDWHKQNLHKNPSHYSFLCRALGIDLVNDLQNWAPGLFFNPFIKIKDIPTKPGASVPEFKYGVVSSKTLIEDCLYWNSLYVAGRLHKPVVQIFPHQPDEFSQQNRVIHTAMRSNFIHALATALLLQEESTISERKLFSTIAGLSYLGDVRMGIGENPNKISNLVSGISNMNEFRKLYSEFMQYFEELGLIKVDTTTSVLSEEGRTVHITCHPIQLLDYVPKSIVPQFHTLNKNTIRAALAHEISLKNNFYSKRQSLKGIVTSGIFRSLRYATHKVQKRLGSTPVEATKNL